jgi:hypothetical protein
MRRGYARCRLEKLSPCVISFTYDHVCSVTNIMPKRISAQGLMNWQIGGRLAYADPARPPRGRAARRKAVRSAEPGPHVNSAPLCEPRTVVRSRILDYSGVAGGATLRFICTYGSTLCHWPSRWCSSLNLLPISGDARRTPSPTRASRQVSSERQLSPVADMAPHWPWAAMCH